jgi:hypothetical protein
LGRQSPGAVAYCAALRQPPLAETALRPAQRDAKDASDKPTWPTCLNPGRSICTLTLTNGKPFADLIPKGIHEPDCASYFCVIPKLFWRHSLEVRHKVETQSSVYSTPPASEANTFQAPM